MYDSPAIPVLDAFTLAHVVAENAGAHTIPVKSGLSDGANALGEQPHNANELHAVTPSLTDIYDLDIV